MNAPSPRRVALGAAITGHDGAESGSQLVDWADEPADPGRWLRRWAWPAIVAGAIAFGMIAGGVDAWRSILVAIGVGVALWSVLASVSSYRPVWHDDIPGQTFHPASAWEVSGLAGARESPDSFAGYLRPRLWSVTADLLRLRGIDPASDRAREIVGRREYALLTGEDGDPRRMTSSVSALCQTVARLAAPGGEAGTPALRRLVGRERRPAGRRIRPTVHREDPRA